MIYDNGITENNDCQAKISLKVLFHTFTLSDLVQNKLDLIFHKKGRKFEVWKPLNKNTTGLN